MPSPAPVMQYIRLGTYTLEEVLPYVILDADKLPNVADRGSMLIKVYTGYELKMNTKNLQLYVTKGTACAECGVEAKFFAVETQYSDLPDQYPHLNLYTEDNVLFTKDHIIPKAAGGSNSLKNLQPMCLTCNGEKADNVDNGAYINGEFK